MAIRGGVSGVAIAAMPTLFVVLWSTGFIGAKLGLPDAEPFTFLLLRFAAVVAVMGAVVALTRAPWPATPAQAAHIAVVGMLVHAVYLGGMFTAMHRGLPAGLTALIGGLQPLLTAILVGPVLGERVTGRQWLGLVLGFGGVAMVLSEKVAPAGGQSLFQGFDAVAVAAAAAGLVAITAGTVYQKRFCQAVDLRTGSMIQYAAATVVVGLAALLFEDFRVRWSAEFMVALGWLVLVLSIGAVTLLMALIRRGEAARVASLFYMVPPVTALFAWIGFGERLGPVALAGMAVAVGGVALVVARR